MGEQMVINLFLDLHFAGWEDGGNEIKDGRVRGD